MMSSIKIAEEIVSRNNNDGTVIVMKLDDSNFFYKIDGVAALIWKELSAQKDLDQIKKNILDTYNTSSDVLERDIEALLGDLKNKKLIV